jgi:hypothetical protein
MGGRSKRELVEMWRVRSDEARQKYRQATEAFKRVWDEHYSPILTRDARFAIEHAQRVESAALQEWRRVLKSLVI